MTSVQSIIPRSGWPHLPNQVFRSWFYEESGRWPWVTAIVIGRSGRVDGYISACVVLLQVSLFSFTQATVLSNTHIQKRTSPSTYLIKPSHQQTKPNNKHSSKHACHTHHQAFPHVAPTQRQQPQHHHQHKAQPPHRQHHHHKNHKVNHTPPQGSQDPRHKHPPSRHHGHHWHTPHHRHSPRHHRDHGNPPPPQAKRGRQSQRRDDEAAWKPYQEARSQGRRHQENARYRRQGLSPCLLSQRVVFATL